MVDYSAALDFNGLEQQNGLPPGLLAAVMKQESGGNPKAISPKGAIGLFQFEPATAQQYGIDPRDPAQSAYGAAKMLGELSNKYQGSLPHILAGYNWGQGNVDKKGLENAPPETQGYMSKILSSLNPISSANAAEVKQPQDLGAELGYSSPQQPQQAQTQDLGAELGYKPQNKPDTFDTVGDQFLQGATFGFGDEAQSALAAAALSAMNGKSLKENYDAAKTVSKNRLQQEVHDSPVTSVVSNLGGGFATALAGGATKAGAAVGDWLGAGNLPVRMAKGALAGTASGGLYGAGTADEGGRLAGAISGAKTGAIVGGAIPPVAAGVGAVKNAILPKVAPDAQELAQKALDYGIPLSRSQVGDSKFAKTLASTTGEVPLSGAPQFVEKQAQAFNRAVSKTFGEDADKITPDVIDAAYKNIGAKYDYALKGKTIKIVPDTPNYTPQHLNDAVDEWGNLKELEKNLINSVESKAQLSSQQGGFWRGRSITFAADEAKNLANVRQQISSQESLIGKIEKNISNPNTKTKNYIQSLAELQQDAETNLTQDHAAIVKNNINNLLNNISPDGTISGEKLGSLRSSLSSTLKNTRNDASSYLGRLRDEIMDMAGQATPVLKQANAQYKALKTIEPLAVKATESGGNISPSLLQARVAQSFRDYSGGGGGQLGDLARIGQRFIKETVPNSGTARRLAAYKMLYEIPGATAGALAGGAPGAAAGAVGTMAGARGFNALNTFQPLVRSAVDAGPQSSTLIPGLLGGNISQLANRQRLTTP